MTMAFQLTEQQQSVLDNIKKFLDSDSSVFILKGYAGTGKTTMVKQIVDYITNSLHKKASLMAPTGRAARVLLKKTGCEACTIHKGIYDKSHYVIKEVKDIAESSYKVVFGIKNDNMLPIVIVDEASMVSSKKAEHELFEFGTSILLDDLLTFVKPSFGGKVIFIGDPAQLPPVGDNHSCALDEDFFKDKGLKCEVGHLTQVLRQGGESTILKNAMKIRDIINSGQRNKLAFEEKDGEVVSLNANNVVDKYLSLGCEAENGGAVVIAYSNHLVSKYNKEIRCKKFGKELPLQVDEPLMVVKNNYSLKLKGQDVETQLMNGDFTRVVSLGEVSPQSALVYVQRGGVKERVKITLNFQDAVVLDNDKEEVQCKLIIDLLDNNQPALTVDEQKALYINFRMRHSNLKPDSMEFAKMLEHDPFVNALEVKYGYAVTGHKCQGGEWKNVFVDYEGRTGLDNDSLRWNYTATTRAQKTLYVINLPHITPFDKFRIDNISTVKKIKPEFRIYGEINKDPFHPDSAAVYLRAKTQCILYNMEFTPYKIKSIESKPYREIYDIETPDGMERYDLLYKASGVFMPAKPQQTTKHTVLLETLLDDEHCMPTTYQYTPSDDIHAQLYAYIQSGCDSLGIPISNVVEHNDEYYTMFYFSTSGTISSLQVFINARGFITYAKPASFIGNDDKELEKLVENLRA